MIKTALIGINAKFSHTNLAVRYLKKTWQTILDPDIFEFTINDSLESFRRIVVEQTYDIIGFSVYIWNVEIIEREIYWLLACYPDAMIVVGGPEALHFMNNESLRSKICFIRGAGESRSGDIISLYQRRLTEKDVFLIHNTQECTKALKNEPIPVIYQKGMDISDKQYLYYESSRGCPFRCSFCMSSFTKGILYKPIDEVFRELSYLLDQKPMMIKFIDRTANSSPERFAQLIEFLHRQDNGFTSVHFEIHPLLFTDEMIQAMQKLRKGYVQFEVGIQSTNSKTLKEIHRYGNSNDVLDACKKMAQLKNVHLHVDLIAGLPHEDYDSFSNSFNEVYEIGAEKIQLGFLKVLKESLIYQKQEEYGMIYDHHAPYEVWKTDWLSPQDLARIKGVEVIVDRFVNEGFFSLTLKGLLKTLQIKPWTFFERFADYCYEKGYLYRNLSRMTLYNILLDYLSYLKLSNEKHLISLLKMDYYMNGNKTSTNLNFTVDEDELKEAIQLFKSMVEKDKDVVSQVMGKDLSTLYKKAVFVVDDLYPGQTAPVDHKRYLLIFLSSSVYFFDYQNTRAITHFKKEEIYELC